jgi:predicted dinucleotide-utilizing enzyme
MNRPLRTVLLGGGTIARLVLEEARRGALPGIELAAIAGRSESSPAAVLAHEFGLQYVVGGKALLALRPDAVLEAASHEAVRQHLVSLLDAGIGVIVLSAARSQTMRCVKPRRPRPGAQVRCCMCPREALVASTRSRPPVSAE